MDRLESIRAIVPPEPFGDKRRGAFPYSLDEASEHVPKSWRVAIVILMIAAFGFAMYLDR
jgi:hypothetical protein